MTVTVSVQSDVKTKSVAKNEMRSERRRSLHYTDSEPELAVLHDRWLLFQYVDSNFSARIIKETSRIFVYKLL